jgi:hypothetical protein
MALGRDREARECHMAFGLPSRRRRLSTSRGVAPEVSAQRGTSGAANRGGGPQAPPTRLSFMRAGLQAPPTRLAYTQANRMAPPDPALVTSYEPNGSPDPALVTP